LSVLRGTLDVLVLRALLYRPMHGFEITAWLDRHGSGNLAILDSALYQAVYRLERQRLIAAEWGTTENRRQARYYRIMPRGKAHLVSETESWLRYATTVTGILTGRFAEG